MILNKIRDFLFGSPHNPFDKETKRHISLIAFLAWVGLGADGISSACYGPEEAFLALGNYKHLAIYLAIATAFTVFVISYAYTNVTELFPNGGGGYRVATRLLGKHVGLISGSALIVDYVLTIAISIASGMDAVFSFFPVEWHEFKLSVAIFLVLLLAFLNMRGMKESVKFLLPIFLGFMITHIFLIIYGIAMHKSGLPQLFPSAANESKEMMEIGGWVFFVSVFLKAFSVGGGTYTGLEAVSNNVHTLSEPKIRTAKITMFLLAISLAFMAAGIIVLYLLWDVAKDPNLTLNASVFYNITQDWVIGDFHLGVVIVPIVLIFEAGLLLVAANSGFLAGPTVIANMATDEWMPKSFSALSSRLVTKNGIIFMAVSAILTLIITGGSVGILVVLYSINVFITFSLSLLGLVIYWSRNRRSKSKWKSKLFVSLIGFIVCFSILIITIFEKFYEGGWVTLLITSIFVIIGLLIHNMYKKFRTHLSQIESQFFSYECVANQGVDDDAIDRNAPTAAIIVDQNFGSGMNSLIEIKKLFPGMFKNFIFVTVGEFDSNNFREERRWREMRRKTKSVLMKYRNYCNASGSHVRAYVGYGTDSIEKLNQLTDRVRK